MKTKTMTNDSSKKTYFDETVLFPLSFKSEGIVYEDRFKKIEKIIAQFDSFKKEYFVSDFGEKSAVLVIRDQNILLARQYRILINKLSFEIPGGKVDESECPEEAAIRECFEETGVVCFNLKPLITFDPDLDYTRNHTHVFCTNQIESNPNPNNELFEWVPVKKCLKMIQQGIITDSLSIISIMAYQLKAGSSW